MPEPKTQPALVPAIPDSQREEFIQHYARARNIRVVAETWRVSWHTADRALKRFGVDTSVKRVDIEQDRRLGKMTDYQLSKELGVQKNTVRRARIRRGIPAFVKPPKQ